MTRFELLPPQGTELATRAVIIATATATFGIGSLAVVLAQLLS